MVKVSKNLNRRLQLLREQIQLIKYCQQYNRKLDENVYKDCQQMLTVCKQLLKKEKGLLKD